MADGTVMLAITTFSDSDQARQVGTQLVQRQCVVCVNLLPAAESIYFWEGAIRHDNEIVALMKTTHGKLADLKNALMELSSYTCPELIALPVTDGLPAYLDWVSNPGLPATEPPDHPKL